VQSGVPRIYTKDHLPPPLSMWGRLVSVGLALGCLTVMFIGTTLKPSPTGISTHTDLGRLQRCQFEYRTGLPCPSCGFTTSMAHFVRGDIIAAIYVQPMGALVAFATAATVWIGGYIAVTGRPVHRLFAMLPGRALLIALLSFAIAAWGYKMWIHKTGRGGWG
jgi:hypothetical protein